MSNRHLFASPSFPLYREEKEKPGIKKSLAQKKRQEKQGGGGGKEEASAALFKASEFPYVRITVHDLIIPTKQTNKIRKEFPRMWKNHFSFSSNSLPFSRPGGRAKNCGNFLFVPVFQRKRGRMLCVLRRSKREKRSCSIATTLPRRAMGSPLGGSPSLFPGRRRRGVSSDLAQRQHS